MRPRVDVARARTPSCPASRRSTCRRRARAARTAWSRWSCGGPCCSESETSVVRTAASGTSALISVDLPMPDWPTSTVCCPASQGSAAAASRLAAISHHRIAQRCDRREPLAQHREIGQVAACSRTTTKRHPADSAAIIQRLHELLVEREVGGDHAGDLRDVGGEQLLLERVGAIDEVACAARTASMTPPPATGTHVDAVAAPPSAATRPFSTQSTCAPSSRRTAKWRR